MATSSTAASRSGYVHNKLEYRVPDDLDRDGTRHLKAIQFVGIEHYKKAQEVFEDAYRSASACVAKAEQVLDKKKTELEETVEGAQLSDKEKDALEQAVVHVCVFAVWATTGNQDEKQAQIFRYYRHKLQKLGLISTWEKALTEVEEKVPKISNPLDLCARIKMAEKLRRKRKASEHSVPTTVASKESEDPRTESGYRSDDSVHSASELLLSALSQETS